MFFYHHFLRLGYSLFFYLAVPFLFLRALWRSRKVAKHRQRWLERLGYFKGPKNTGGIWFHAVSLGETIAAIPLIKATMAKYPNQPICVTTTTPTGSEKIIHTFGNTVFHVYLPYDLPGAVKRFLNTVQPNLGIIMETELWPNLLFACKKLGVPTILANARMSPHSLKGYMRFKGFIQSIMNQLSFIGAQSQVDYDHFYQVGCTKAILNLIGNIKYDLNRPSHLDEHAFQLKTAWKGTTNRPILIAASTHPGEEKIILNLFKQLRNKYEDMLLLLVPRHPERFSEVAELINQQGFTSQRRSIDNQKSIDSSVQVYLCDTLGELNLLYGTADVAFIGGSLTPIGGHNMLEAAAAGIPVIVGPHLHNFVEVSEKLLAAKAMIKVEYEAELLSSLLTWFANPKAMQTAGKQGLKVVAENKGAVEKLINVMPRFYPALEKS